MSDQRLADIPPTPESLLVKLKIKLSIALNITPHIMKALVDRYVAASLGQKTTSAHFTKINTYNELSANKMTVKVFFKFLAIARIKQLKITIVATTVTNKQVTVEEEVNLLNFSDLHDVQRETKPNPDKKEESVCD